ncbi:MarR family winged helix-turn-helix transcriptional regulator [Pseudonocardia endophytica]|uniref:DNA-binding MarR family transcriptional regulator n=1 Tax=Pseudonocardia endophytica TaxID=401976 RepID=A0A4R1HPX9_PSEEN|nr:MarR family winged helix-turn-helix transcriptional regulator [Pseudonocardia endophytica]TCK22500.1 DNA-binding MarR family transcriptional regulator [Pseudonocardia endophytica]
MPTTTATAQELFAVVTGLRRVVRRRLRDRVPGPRLRGAQLELLQAVEAEPGIGVAAAADALHLAQNSVSTLVNQLVAEDLLERGRDPSDRRAVRLRLTEAAEQRLRDWREARGRLVDDALAGLPAAEAAAITAALPALAHLLERIEEGT